MHSHRCCSGISEERQGTIKINNISHLKTWHYDDVRMDAIASQITSLTFVYSIVYLDADQRKHQSSVSLAFVRGIHRGPVNFPHKWPVTRKMFPFDDVIMIWFWGWVMISNNAPIGTTSDIVWWNCEIFVISKYLSSDKGVPLWALWLDFGRMPLKRRLTT